jgi:hypothetical protein
MTTSRKRAPTMRNDMATAASPARVATAAARARIGRGRRALVWTLLVVASVLGLLMITGVWVNRQMLDRSAWRKASSDVIKNEQVQTSLAAYLVNQLYQNVDVTAAIEQELPPNLQHLAPQLSAALRRPAQGAATLVLQRPRVQNLFIEASARAHDKLVNVLENKTGFGISTGNGVVTLDVRALLQQLSAQLGLPGKAAARIPEGRGKIVLLRSSNLKAAQQGVRAVKVLSVWLAILVFGLYAAAIYLARGARRVALRRTGWSLVILGVLVLVIRRRLGDYAVVHLSSPTYRGTIHDVWLIGTSILGQIGEATLAYGVILVLAAVLAGPTRIAVATRRSLAPILNEQPWLAGGVALGLYLIVLAWGPTHALRTWWGALLFGVLGAVAILALRRQTRSEFPAQTA